MMARTILLNPGPVTLSDRVRQALVAEDQCHRETEFAQLTLDIRRRLLAVYPAAQAAFEAVLLTGSGTLAVESMLASLLPATGKTLAIVNGLYGQRIVAMLQAHGKPHVVVEQDWLAPLALDRIEQCLAADRDIRYVVAVHNETTSGRLNDLDAVGRLCRKFDCGLLLDAVSSFGAERIDFESWNLEAVALAANKCLHAIPGLALVVAKKSAFTQRTSAARGLYLDLFRYQREQQSGFSPFTPAVQACFALREALCELQETGGWMARQARYRERSARVRRILSELGLDLLLPPEDFSSMITSFALPDGLEYATLHDRLRAAGFVIYAGLGRLAGRSFRIATMGDIRPQDLDRLEAALRAALREPACVQ